MKDDVFLGGDIRTLLINELAKVLSDEASAVAFVRRVGFPPAMLPSFSKPIVFWTQVVNDVISGVMGDGAKKLTEQATQDYPGNATLKVCNASFARLIRQFEIDRHTTLSGSPRLDDAGDPDPDEETQRILETIFDRRCSKKGKAELLARRARENYEYVRRIEDRTTHVFDAGRVTSASAPPDRWLVPVEPSFISPPHTWPQARHRELFDGHCLMPRRSEVTMGRGDSSDVHFEHGGVSSLHAVLATDQLIDCCSTNGTFVNGLDVAKCGLHSGDVVQLGKSQKLLYIVDCGPSSSVGAASEQEWAVLALDGVRASESISRKQGASERLRRFLIRMVASGITNKSIFSYPGHTATLVRLADEQECLNVFELILQSCKFRGVAFSFPGICGGVAIGDDAAAMKLACERLDRALCLEGSYILGASEKPRKFGS